MPGPQPAVSAPDRTARAHARPSRTPRGRLLGNGRFRTLFTEAGTGGAWFGEDALTAWRGDRVEDADGWFVYVRDLEDGMFWSLGARPVPGPPGDCGVEDGPGWMAVTRTAHGIAGRMEVWVDPELSAECRRITLRNLDDRPRVLDLTSMLEVVLCPPGHHAAHPGFSRLFVQTGFDDARRALLAWRRPRGAGERHPWLLHRVLGGGALGYETDRGGFLGRGHGPDAPQAMLSRARLAGAVGDVLDPVLALRRTVDLAPLGMAQLDLLLAAGEDRDAVLAVADRLADANLVHTSRERAIAAALGPEGDGTPDARRLELERFAAALLYRDPGLRCASATGPVGAGALELALAHRPALTIRGPLVLVEAGTPDATVAFAREAHDFWRAAGLATTLAIVSDGEPAASDPEHGRHVLAARELGAEDLARLRAGADLHLDGGIPSLGTLETTERAAPADARDPGVPSAAATRGRGDGAGSSEPPWPFGDEALRFFNGWGGFSPRGDEYVIRLPRDPSGALRLTPRPWTNVLANPGFGALISESGAGCTWSRNSREFRLTPWNNDAVRDPHDEALYLRDEQSGRLWSPFPGPIPGRGRYEMRHGFGISRGRHAGEGLVSETEVFVHASEPVKVIQVRVTNAGRTVRRLSLSAFQRLVLGHGDAPQAVSTWEDAGSGILFARTRAVSDHAGATAFAATVAAGGGLDRRSGTDREQILGRGGSPARPAALLSGAGPDGRTGSGFDPCFCQQVRFDLAPGASRTLAFLLGETQEVGAIEAMVERLRRPGALEAAREEVTAAWAERLGRVRIETPSEPLDLLANGWLAYQTLACRLWARTAFYQSGGAFGYRDQLQDAAAFLATDPALTREQILLHSAHQFAEGDVLHWWHPPHGRGIRTRFADDLLWLPYVTAAYVAATGDWRVLDERTRFLVARPLSPGEDEAFLLPEPSGETGDVYEHGCRALDRSLATGPHGLPLFGTGDWNDGMNRVGREGRGESVWMAFFLHAVIDAFLPLCERRRDATRAARLRAHQAALREAIERAGWDGGWYRRGYYDDGTPLGAADSDECRIDALVQAWAVLSGAAPAARAERAMDAMTRELVSWDEGTLWLLAPPFDRTPHDPGYIKGYLPGVRENGGQYTHAALWGVAAMARLGRREEAARLLERMSPVWRTRTAEHAGVYQVEPYVVAADVYSNAQHRGRGGWTWYTGSAGWMLRVTLESILGVTLERGSTLVVRASIPAGWSGYRMRLRPFGRAGTWSIEVRNGSPGTRVAAIRLDGRPVHPVDGVARLPLPDDGRDHQVEIRLG